MTAGRKSRFERDRSKSDGANQEVRTMAMKYTDEMREFILGNYKGIYNKELAERFNKRFQTDVTAQQVSAYKKNHQLHSGLDGRFKKGQIPYNKGKKISEEIYHKCQPTMFKKGNVPHNHKIVGSERITKDGYIEIKIAEPRKWKLKHIWVWEQHNGPVTKGYVVVMLDRNKQNTDLSNLRMIKRSELLVMNRYGLYTENAELNNTAVNLATLMDKTARKKHI